MPAKAGQQHIGADRRSQRHEQRKGGERVGIFHRCCCKISVEERVRRRVPVIADEIHHGECKVVDDIDRRHFSIEFDRIEQNGFAIDQYDVRQMQVAVAAPHESRAAALLQQAANRGKRRPGRRDGTRTRCPRRDRNRADRLRPDDRWSGARRSESFQWRIRPVTHCRRSQAIHRCPG